MAAMEPMVAAQQRRGGAGGVVEGAVEGAVEATARRQLRRRRRIAIGIQ